MSAIKFGKHKGTEIKNLPTDYLKWLLNQSQPGKVLDPNHAEYGQSNQKVLDEIKSIYDARPKEQVAEKHQQAFDQQLMSEVVKLLQTLSQKVDLIIGHLGIELPETPPQAEEIALEGQDDESPW